MHGRSFAGQAMSSLHRMQAENLVARKALGRGDYAAAAVAVEKILREAKAAKSACESVPLEIALV